MTLNLYLWITAQKTLVQQSFGWDLGRKKCEEVKSLMFFFEMFGSCCFFCLFVCFPPLSCKCSRCMLRLQKGV